MARVGFKAMSCGLGRLLGSRHKGKECAHKKAPEVLAIVSKGPDQALLQSLSQELGWNLTFLETPPGIAAGCEADVPPIVIYDRRLSPVHWQDAVVVLSKTLPRPYVILLSPNADTNLWDELQRVGGSDILRTPIERDTMMGAVKRAWLLWSNQQRVRSPLPDAGQTRK